MLVSLNKTPYTPNFQSGKYSVLLKIDGLDKKEAVNVLWGALDALPHKKGLQAAALLSKIRTLVLSPSEIKAASKKPIAHVGKKH